MKTDKLKVYIASPYTIGDVAVNVRVQLDTADELMDMGLVPFAPLMSHFQHLVHPRPYEDWIDVDLEWVKSCDILLRLEGKSDGADNEVYVANSLKLHVVYGMAELKRQINAGLLTRLSEYYIHYP